MQLQCTSVIVNVVKLFPGETEHQQAYSSAFEAVSEFTYMMLEVGKIRIFFHVTNL